MGGGFNPSSQTKHPTTSTTKQAEAAAKNTNPVRISQRDINGLRFPER
jgi:hypothetical protein